MIYKINNYLLFYNFMVWLVTTNVFLHFLIREKYFENWTFFMSIFEKSI